MQADGTPSAGQRGQLELTELGPVGPGRLTYRQIDWAPVDEPAEDRVNLLGHWGGHGRVHDDTGGTFPGLAPTFDGEVVQDISLIDPASVGATALLLTALVIEQVSIVGLGASPTISLGTNGPGFTNVIPATLLVLSASSKRALILRPHDFSAGAGPTSLLIPSGATLTLRVSVGGTGTTILLRPHVLGLLLR